MKLANFYQSPIFYVALLSLTSCSYVHRVQLGDIDDRDIFNKKYFEVKVSDTGINIKEIGGIVRAVSAKKTANKSKEVEDIIALFQMGPRTGNPVYNESYAENIFALLRQKCPKGKLTLLSSIREMRKYPVVSGEIVKISGYCLSRKVD